MTTTQLATHTPGPWRIVPDSPGFDVESEEFRIARMCIGCLEFEANARLIAAAPKLLAACQFAADPENDWHHVYEKARAAIAEATKESV